MIIVAVRHPTNHNHERCNGQLWEITSCLVASRLSQIHLRLLVASLSLFPHHLNLTCTLLQKYLNPLLPNPYGIINTFQMQPVLKSHQIISNCCLPVQGSILNLVQTVLSPHNGPMFLLHTPSHPYIFHLFKLPTMGCPIIWAKCFTEKSVCFRLIGAVPATPPMSNETSLSTYASCSSEEISRNEGKLAIPSTYVPHSSMAS